MRFFVLFFILFPITIVCQNTKKETYAKRISEKVVIDGLIDELFWHNIDDAEHFIMMEPDNGKYERNTQKTKVKSNPSSSKSLMRSFGSLSPSRLNHWSALCGANVANFPYGPVR